MKGKPSQLLKDLGPIFVGHGCDPPSKDLMDTIKLSGGRVALSSKRAALCLASSAFPVRNVDVPVVSELWLIGKACSAITISWFRN